MDRFIRVVGERIGRFRGQAEELAAGIELSALEADDAVWVVAKDTMKAETNQGRSRRSFDETFKRHAVALTLKGDRPIAQIAQERD